MTADTTIYLIADADPTLLVRVTGVLSTLSLLPSKLSVIRSVDDTMSITIDLCDAGERVMDLLHRNLTRLPQYVDVEIVRRLARVAC